MDLVLASANSHKVYEIKDIIGNSFSVKSLADIGYVTEIPETGSSFEENSLLKAKTIFEFANKPVIADDSGLLVDVLDGQPGIFSARFAGLNATAQENNHKLLHLLTNKTPAKASFYCVICLYLSPNNIHYFTGSLSGYIVNEPIGDKGFGYDPIFKPENSNYTLAQYTTEQKNTISHRAIALQKLKTFLHSVNESV